MSKKKKVDPLIAHELLHGAFLAHSMLDTVGQSGSTKGNGRKKLFKAHPHLRRAYNEAMHAVWQFYTACSELEENK